MTNFTTIAYRARSSQQVARILNRHRVVAGDRRRSAALREFHRHGRTVLATPHGRLVIHRKG